MADIMSKEKRSRLMSRIKASGTGIERAMLKGLRNRKIRGFKYLPKMFGKPDFCFPDKRLVVFCDGDFWHGYDFRRIRKKLAPFWATKIARNVKRDRLVRGRLERQGWGVVRFWEHDIEKNLNKCLNIIERHKGMKW